MEPRDTRCRTIVLSCLDYRVIAGLPAWLAAQGLAGRFDLVAAAGGAKNLASPRRGGDRDFILEQFAIAGRFHALEEVILIIHEDCQAYGGRQAFGAPGQERAHHEQELRQAGEIVRAKLPHLRVRLVFAPLDPAADAVSFEAVRGATQ